MSLIDPRPPKPAAELIQTDNGPILAQWVYVAAIHPTMIEAIAQRVAEILGEQKPDEDRPL